MMKFTKSLLQKMLIEALTSVENNLDYLNQLDSAIGDGDHGTAILAAMRAAVESSKKDGTLSETLDAIGWDVMSSTNGSTSALNGSFFAGMATAVSGEELDADQTIAMFDAGLTQVQTATKAKLGDKTLMDSLLPAIEAMDNLTGSGTSLADLFKAAAEAAQRGADGTKDLVAKHGRARNLGQRSQGHLDAGAVSTATIYTAYFKAVSK